MSAIRFDRVSIVFGDTPERALPMMDEGKSRAEIQEATGQILGAHDCSLDVARGEICVLMGLSGSGKSTLLRAANRLNPITRGSVFIDAGDGPIDVASLSPKALAALRGRTIAMVFQQFGLLPWRTVLANVAFGLELRGMAKARRLERARDELSRVGLDAWADKRVDQLSGGMQQRVGLARAFATDAPILLMDEPFSALDPLIRAKLQDELLEFQRALGRTILFVSHDLDEAIKLGDRVAIMREGRILQHAPPRDILLAPAGDHVRAFTENADPLAVLTAADAMIPSTDPLPEDAVHPDAPLRDVLDALARGPLAVRDDAPRGVLTAQAVLAALRR